MALLSKNGQRALALALFALVPAVGLAQTSLAPKPAAPPQKAAPPQRAATDGTVVPPPGYVIGVDDLLTVRFWGDVQMSGDVVVRSDGKISLPLLEDVQASGYTPIQLSEALEKAASKFIAEPDATVMVREIRSRKVYVLGQGIAKPGVLPLNSEMSVLHLLAAAGGLLEYADKSNIVIIRKENGREKRLRFNFDDVVRGRNVQQNILLQPDDVVLVN
jgi:polysaccharide export outer membrane protein